MIKILYCKNKNYRSELNKLLTKRQRSLKISGKIVKKIIVIDDLLNRNHDCDLFIDQSINRKIGNNVPKKCKRLLGPKYALLRKEISKRNQKIKMKQKIKQILVSFGGGDDKNQKIKALEVIKKIEDK